MRRVRTLLSLLAAGLVAAVGISNASAKGRAKLVGASLIDTVKPATGFVDDPFTFDDAGGRLLWVNADAARKADLRVIDLAQGGAQLFSVDISSFTATPTEVEFVLDGEHFYVRSQPDKDGPAKAALIDRKGKVIRSWGPADDVQLTLYDGQDVVVTYQTTKETVKEKKTGKEKVQIKHSISTFNLESGKRVGAERVLVSDDTGYVEPLDFRIVYWADGYTRAVGIKGGAWDRKEDQRSPDYEAWYDTNTGTFTKRINIKNVIEHTKTLKLLAEHSNQKRFLMVANDLSGVRLIGERRQQAVKLAEPFHHYDHNSLQWHSSPDGGFFFTLKIDPVNADAVARRRADPEYLDLYQLAPGSTKAVRKARLLLKGKRDYGWRATSEYWVVVPKHIGFDRGGKALRIYKLK